ncbi:glycosyltransferase family 4 protein [Taibaiella lutea]|uniref:Glycosyltransferase family 4 protein n=1 Tax=Taibaiella lutea TaxID=2608001 RepID=A0A5M6CKC0_9BACT|nr:glycosyltransferase family 4 protein [Taibaiella lutea]KAA5533785.1 glycosyltransferase family 4 protein [Taibaiella lutea]
MTVTKPVILIFTASYLPGYKAGGILRTIVNTVDHLYKYYHFKIVTLDRDLGDKKAYDAITSETWLQVGNAEVYYLKGNIKLGEKIKKLIRNTEFDIIHLNSFFDPVFTIKIISYHWLRLFKKKPVILAPRGELNNTQLKFKWHKKQVYILFFRFFNLDKQIIYHASDQQEANDISKALNIPLLRIKVAQDLPKPIDTDILFGNYYPQNKQLKILFLSRISREKNLKYAIEILQMVNVNVCFHIYGPIEDTVYWEECKVLMKSVPGNISIEYCGMVRPEEVDETMQKYDLFFLPTFAENFGHVIAEALVNGLPVLISNGTPWINLPAKSFGWDIDLNDRSAFVRVIEQFSKTNIEQRIEERLIRKTAFIKQLPIANIIQENVELYKTIL